MVTGPVTKGWSVGICGICLALNQVPRISYSFSPSGRRLLRLLVKPGVIRRATQVVVFVAILPSGLGLLLHLLRCPQLRVILNGTAGLSRRRRPVTGLYFKTPRGRRVLCARADHAAAYDHESQCSYQCVLVHNPAPAFSREKGIVAEADLRGYSNTNPS
jgi:hypothetical protein